MAPVGWLALSVILFHLFDLYLASLLMSFISRLPRGRAVGSAALKRAYATVSDVSGVKVAGVEVGQPAATTSITVVVKAGTRYEPKPGVAHVLKSFAYKVCSRPSRNGQGWI